MGGGERENYIDNMVTPFRAKVRVSFSILTNGFESPPIQVNRITECPEKKIVPPPSRVKEH